jgi:hypothetical protein
VTKYETKTSKAPVRDKVLSSTRAGLNPREISLALGISTQRVYQHLARLRELGELPPAHDAA